MKYVVPVIALFAACGRAPQLSSAVSDSAGIALVKLSHSLSQVADGSVAFTTLQADLVINARADSLGHIADVAELSTDSLIVLDSGHGALVYYRRDGRQWTKRVIPSPAMERPLALTLVRDGPVVWNQDIAATFLAYGHSGQLIAAVPRPVAGDWFSFGYRNPMLDREYPVQQNFEDATLRFRALDDRHFVHQVQPNERVGPRPVNLAAPPVSLIRYDAALRVVDTLFNLKGAELRRVPRTVDGEAQRFSALVFGAQPLWAVGSGWLALAHGDSSRIVIYGMNRVVRAVLELPNDREAVASEDRLNAAQWLIYYGIAIDSTVRNEWVSLSRRRRERIEREQAGLLYFPVNRPLVTALHGAGRCLFLGGFDSRDEFNGVSRTWTILDVESHAVIGVLRIPRQAGRLREVSARALYVTSRDSSGNETMERFPLPFSSCSSRG